MGEVRVGTSGWSYDHWEHVLYPPGLPARERLGAYVDAFGAHPPLGTVELNASFYRWPPASTFASWRRRLPEGFRLTVKAPRGLTHAKRLYAPEAWVERICAGWHELGERRGTLLLQLHPAHARDDARLAYVLDRFPSWVRVAVEFRHPSWVDDAVFGLLAERGTAYCVMSGAGLPCVLRATASLVYLRLHGPDHNHLYAGSYSEDDLRWWADRVGEWRSSGHDVHAFFNNDGHGHAVRNARRLAELCG